jgi:hypothetical protein
MKNIFAFLFIVSIFCSCSDPNAVINEKVVVEQITTVTNNKDFKYLVKLQTQTDRSTCAYLFTNFKYEVGDSLESFYKFQFSTIKPLNDKLDSLMQRFKLQVRKNDSLTAVINEQASTIKSLHTVLKKQQQ